jgi:hypothetical protein
MLEIRATAAGYVFAGGTGRSLQDLGRIPARAFSAETIMRRTGRHHFTGAMIGLLATGTGARSSAPADFHWFDYAGQATPA